MDGAASELSSRNDEGLRRAIDRSPPAERRPLKLEEPRGAREVGKRFGIRPDEALELRARRELPPHHLVERHVEVLQHAEERRYVSTPIIYYLNRRRA